MNEGLKKKFYTLIAIVGFINAALQGALAYMENAPKDKTKDNGAI